MEQTLKEQLRNEAVLITDFPLDFTDIINEMYQVSIDYIDNELLSSEDQKAINSIYTEVNNIWNELASELPETGLKKSTFVTLLSLNPPHKNIVINGKIKIL